MAVLMVIGILVSVIWKSGEEDKSAGPVTAAQNDTADRKAGISSGCKVLPSGLSTGALVSTIAAKVGAGFNVSHACRRKPAPTRRLS